MKKILSIFLISVLLLSMIACDNGKTPDTNPNDPTSPSEHPTVPNISTTPNGEYDSLSKHSSAAYILDAAYEATDANTMFSPLSLNMALGLVAEGADSKYNDLFNALLDENDYSGYAQKYIEHLSDLNVNKTDNKYDKYKTVFEIANSLWVNDDFVLSDNYIQNVERFNAKAESVDFKEPADVVNKVNTWCAEQTRDMIKEIISEDNISDNTAMIAVNAVYFESSWTKEWNILNEQKDFEMLNGTKTKFTPIRTETAQYYENDFATAFGCDYKNGLTFIGILPKDSGDFKISDLDIETLLNSKTMQYDVTATMPRIKFDNRIENIVDILTGMGYGKLFDKEDGIFTNILIGKNSNVPVTISDIIQADSIELDEKGTKAAAVTAVITDGIESIPMPKETKDVTLDRPFAFIIYDSAMDQIVFIGKVIEITQ